MKNKYLITGSVLVVALLAFFAGKYFVSESKQQKSSFLAQENAQLFIRDHAYRIGPDDAKVHLVEFMDPECESCRMMHPEVKNILKAYEGKIQLIIRYAPFHHNSKMVVQILEAARKQGKYDEVLDVLFHYQPIWGDHHNPRPELIWAYLNNVEGLDIDQVRIDMNSPEIAEIIAKDIEDGKALDVRATPTFFVNGRPLPRFGVSYLRDLIQEEMSKN